MRKRVLVLASTYPRWAGDPEPGFVHQLSARLAKAFDVTVLCPHASGAASLEQLDGVRVHRYRYAPGPLETLVHDGGVLHNLRRQPWKWLLVPGFLLAQVWAIVRLVRGWQPHAIHAHWIVPQGFAAALAGVFRRRRIPLLITCHGSDLHALRGAGIATLKRFAARRADAVTVVSRSMVGPATALGVEPGRVSVQPMGSDLRGRFSPDASVRREAAELLFVGRMVEKKGLRYLIDALPEVLREHPGATLNVAGFGPEDTERREQVTRLGLDGKVRFLGAVPHQQLPALYRRAALLVAPFLEAASGDQEGFGLVVIEAMGCGCPVLASDVPATRDTIEPGANGWLAQPASVQDLAGQVNRLLADAALRERLGAKGIESAQRFDWESVAAGYATVLERMARPDDER